MLNERLYHIGKKHNEVLKYTIEYDIDVLLDYLCSVYITEILSRSDSLISDRRTIEKLHTLLNNLGEL